MGAPYREEVHHAATLNQDQVLAQQVSAYVGHARLGEQPQHTELGTRQTLDPGTLRVDRLDRVPDGRGDVADAPDTWAGGKAEGVRHEQRAAATRIGAQHP